MLASSLSRGGSHHTRGRGCPQNDPFCLCPQSLYGSVEQHVSPFPVNWRPGKDTQSPCNSAASNGASEKSFRSGPAGLGNEVCQNRWDVFTLGSSRDLGGTWKSLEFVCENKIKTLKKDRR